jgi:NADH-quinone oxidoreductase subunit N
MNGFDLTSLITIAPELNLLFCALLALLAGLYVWPKIDMRYLAFVLVSLIGVLWVQQFAEPSRSVTLGGMLIDDSFARLSKLMILSAAILTLCISSRWLTADGGKAFEFAVLIMFSTLGMMLLVSANDLLSVYVALELMSLVLYVLASFERDNKKSSEAGLKYFVLGALASGMLLYGISLIYGFTGTTSFTVLGDYFAQFADEAGTGGINKAILVGLVFIMIGLCFKISAVPFHMWTPDVYEGAPTAVTAFFAVAPKIAAVALLVRVLSQPFADLLTYWQQIVVFMAIASLLVGALGAMMQSNIKRLLAYSSIGHVGFMLMGLATGTSTGVQGVLIYLTLYIFMSVGAFGCVMMLEKDGKTVEQLQDFKGLSVTHPAIAGLLSVFIFSMAGIPPLAGFFGKMYVVLAAITHGLIWLAVIGLMISVAACFYYLKLIKIMYFDEPMGDVKLIRAPLVEAAIVFSALITVAYVVSPALLVTYAQSAAEALLP